MPKEKVELKSNVKPEPSEEIIESLLTKGKPLTLQDTDQKALVKSIKEEFEAIKLERKDIDGEDYDDFLKIMDRQKRGRMPKTAGRAYNLDTRLSKVKCNDIIRTTVAALFGVDPIVSVNPRPGFAKGVGREVCSQQQDFLDYAVDERIPLKSPIRLAVDSATYKRVGVIKWTHKVRKEKRIGHDKYVGKPEIVGQDPQTGQPIINNKPLDDFMLAYGDVIGKEKTKNPKSTKYDWIIKRLAAGKKAEFDYEYDEVTYNDPFPQFVDNKNFYVRKNTNGYFGMCEASLIVERVNFTYYELKKLERENEFVNVNKLIYDSDEDENKDQPRKNFATETYNVLECVYYARLPGDDEYTKIVCWIAEDKMVYLGGIYYPYTVLDCYYVPHYVKCTGVGFYQEGVAEDLTDLHLSRNAILNHTLEAAQMATTVTPITPKDSDADKQFLENTFVNGLPINADPKSIGFLSNLMKPPDIAGLLILDQTISRVAGEISGVSDLRSGKESPLDPNAPGNKTAMLLQESGKDVKDYVDEFTGGKSGNGFNIDMQVILKIYYEMGQDEQEYVERRYRGVTGAEPKKISKAAMIARTSIQSQAMAYDFNKLAAKREDLAMNTFMENQAMIINNPRANYERIKIIMSSWAPKWKNAIDKILPSPEEFNAQQVQIALQAIQMYIQAKVEESKMTGKPPQMLPEELVGMMTQMQAMATMPRDKAQAIQKEQAKEKENV